jgi:hypothetical protein
LKKKELEEKINIALAKRAEHTQALEEKKKELEEVRKLFDACVEEFERHVNGNPSDDFPFRVGFEWRKKKDGGLFEWECVEVENGKGTEHNPIEFIEGMICYAGAVYKDVIEDTIHFCKETGIADSIKNSKIFDLFKR